MTALRILHVDDEPDIREVVELSLGLDPTFSVRSCASGADAIATATHWSPDMILCDVMMPVMDGPATLARLRESPQTAKTPFVFMTARAQAREIEHFKSLGATGVIPKPFDPMTLAKSVRQQLRVAGLASLRDGFIRRMWTDATTLMDCRAGLKSGSTSKKALEQIKSFAHALSGAAGIFDFQEVGRAASALEKSATDRLAGTLTPRKVEGDLDALLDCIKRE
jgi:CheY-like chemotaxis protein/HPt (histidine-containing phosphotransfer) domain-containing protein